MNKKALKKEQGWAVRALSRFRSATSNNYLVSDQEPAIRDAMIVLSDQALKLQILYKCVIDQYVEDWQSGETKAKTYDSNVLMKRAKDRAKIRTKLGVA